MNTCNFNPTFFVRKNTTISTTSHSTRFGYKNTDATLIIDGELDLSGVDNNIDLHANKIIVTPRGSITGENIRLKADEAVIVHGKVHSKKNLEIDSPVLYGKGGVNFAKSWLGLRQQICSYKDTADATTNTVKELVQIAENSLTGMAI